jgi:hypothetical protein
MQRNLYRDSGIDVLNHSSLMPKPESPVLAQVVGQALQKNRAHQWHGFTR